MILFQRCANGPISRYLRKVVFIRVILQLFRIYRKMKKFMADLSIVVDDVIYA